MLRKHGIISGIIEIAPDSVSAGGGFFICSIDNSRKRGIYYDYLDFSGQSKNF
jgi:hypothetical protein